MKPTKIVFKTHAFPNFSETFVVLNIVGAIQQGYDVAIITNHKKDTFSSSQAELLKQYNVLDKVVSFKQPRKRKSRLFKGLKALLNPIVFYYFIKCCIYKKTLYLDYLYELQFYFAYRNCAVFHVHFAHTTGNIALFKQIGFIKSKLLVTFHGYDAFAETKEIEDKLKLQYALLFKTADKISVNTVFLRDMVSKISTNAYPLSIIPNGIDLLFFKPEKFPKQLKNDEVVKLISVGRLIEFKGHEYGIRAIKLLVDKGFKVHYTIIGMGALEEHLRTLIDELNLGSHITLFGLGTQLEIKRAFELSHVFLMTSVADATGREETQGVVSAEAQAMGLPVVGFNSGGVPYTVSPKTAILVAQKDVEAMAKSIAELILQPYLYTQMSESAREWTIKHFDISNMLNLYYSDLIN